MTYRLGSIMFFAFSDPSAIAQFVTARMINLIQDNPTAVLGLATGSTMEPVYEQFINQVSQQNVDLSGLTTFNLDEYLGLGMQHPQSYHFYMHQHLFNRLAFGLDQTFLPDGLCNDVEKQCRTYSKLIAQAGGIDLQLLGIGTNGHIGFNEPGTAFNSRTHVVELSERTRIDNGRFFDSRDQVPTQAITLGLQDIMEANQILLLATGANKAQVMADLYHSEIDESMPASIIKRHPNAMIIVDQEAAALLPAGVCKTLSAAA